MADVLVGANGGGTMLMMADEGGDDKRLVGQGRGEEERSIASGGDTHRKR